MRALSFLSLATFSAATDAGSAPMLPLAGNPIDTTAARADATTTTADVAPAKLPRAPRKPVAPKPATAKPAVTKLPALAAKPTTTDAKPAPAAPEAEPAVRILPIARTCATIAAQATNFGGVLSDRDAAYIAYYAGLAKRAKAGVVTIRAIADHFTATGLKPAHGGSAKPHDAGVIVRLTKAGVIAPEADGTSFTFTKLGKTLKPYAAA